ncbi:helix-turn-helix transcriptional regulator [Rhodococcus qingshengii]|uniref:helix-turn-helix transcriptional regulator n=1 Tax=Rhodococcus qingshengii TaxID=334542 RepID=UPI001E39F081|nr:helix-turn-helix domain-containing protein [Rhodococcus qingshengii]UDF18764.1 helix-turn-helix domain-containing protein [Rhodococcus qingshengii]
MTEPVTIPANLGVIPLTVRRFVIEEVSQITGFTIPSLRNLHRQGKGPLMYRMGKRLYCDEPDLLAWSAQQKAATAKGIGA